MGAVLTDLHLSPRGWVSAMPVRQPDWLCPPVNPALTECDVHVWCATLDWPTKSVQRLAETLSEGERARVVRFRFEKDKRRYVVGRGVLRTILGRYVGAAPGQVQFCYGPQGKPYLAQGTGDGTLQFNMTRSHELALYVISRGRRVGIDLEYIRPEVECEQIAAQFFSPREGSALSKQPAEAKHKAFFACWTRKEAYVKARGAGLSLPLDRFDVSVAPGGPAMLLSVSGDPLALSRWSLEDLVVKSGYAAALAVEGHSWRLACWEYPGP